MLIAIIILAWLLVNTWTALIYFTYFYDEIIEKEDISFIIWYTVFGIVGLFAGWICYKLNKFKNKKEVTKNESSKN